ncbi:hypothetical protein QO010_004095 [Caulobacter ginsengisoli]|uniref:CBU-0592-like domain-containing protein n=1 Tax=Caulobacter ginsengisoli TaxID=400775 RepID=A0ABU0IWA5_9CAUL|nr:hypothetical protein [Caulobacter ginsengisoli]MDQ0466302.1 hypothetical protein [Caulobacter ginsengisoli]
MAWYDIVGVIGTATILIAYGLTSTGRLDPQKAPALTANGVGSGLILLSLTQAWNMSAAIVEGAWALISLFGLTRLLWKRRS